MAAATPQDNNTQTHGLLRPATATDRFVTYIDTLVLNLSRAISRAMLAELEARNGNRVKVWTPMHGGGYRPRTRKIALSQPTLAALVYARLNLPVKQIARIDFAIDEMAGSPEAARRLLDERWQALSMKWGGCYGSDHVAGEVRYIAASDRSRGIAGYADRPSKVTGASCCHIELRLRTPKACRAIGLFKVEDIAALDLFDALAHNIRWTQVADAAALHEAVERRLARCRGLRGVVRHACRIELGQDAPASWDKLPASFLWRWLPTIARQHLHEVSPPFTREAAMIKPHTFLTPWNPNPNSPSLPQLMPSHRNPTNGTKQPNEQPQEFPEQPKPETRVSNSHEQHPHADLQPMQSRNGTCRRRLIRVRMGEHVAVPRRRIVRVHIPVIQRFRVNRRGTKGPELSGANKMLAAFQHISGPTLPRGPTTKPLRC